MEEKKVDIGLLEGLGSAQEDLTVWLKEKSHFLWVGLGVVFLGFLLFFVFFFRATGDFSGVRQKVEQDIQLLESFSLGSKDEMVSLARSVEKRLYSYPELPPLYEGRLTQALLAIGATSDAKEHLGRHLNRLVSPNPIFTAFTESSLMISEGNLQAAWEKENEIARELRFLSLDRQQEDWMATLSAFNLVRRTLLANQLDKRSDFEALATELLSESKRGSKSLEKVVEIYRVGSKTILSVFAEELASRLPSVEVTTD